MLHEKVYIMTIEKRHGDAAKLLNFIHLPKPVWHSTYIHVRFISELVIIHYPRRERS